MTKTSVRFGGTLDRLAAGWLAAALLLGACGDSHTPGDGGDEGGMSDAAPMDGTTADGGPADAARDAGPPPSLAGAPVDILFVVDNSGSMWEEQTNLARELPRFFGALATGEIRDRDSGEVRVRFDPVDDLHVGVVTTDMGTGGHPLETCYDATDGDDGILSTAMASDCTDSLPRFLRFGPGDDPEAFARDASCKVRLGTDGCGFEQQLEAALKALLPAGVEGTLGLGPYLTGTGHGDAENAGFLRPDSILVVVLLTDEDDCSANTPTLFDPSAFGGATTLNARCFLNSEALHPVRRYVQGLSWLRRDDPRRLVFAAFAGLPPGLGSTAAGPTDWERIACTPARAEAGSCDPRLRPEVVMGITGLELRPSCDTANGLAYPPNRIMRTAELLEAAGHQAVVGSICDELGGPMDVLLRRLAALRR